MNQIFYTGIVENRKDPLALGRVQVRVFGVHSESLEDVPTSSLPWAICLMPATSASLSGIGNSGIGYIEGTLVSLYFQDGESKQQPIILGSAHAIPLGQSPFSKTTEEDDSAITISPNTSRSSVKSSTPDILEDSAGNPVVDSSGEPVKVESTPVEDRGCALVDISKMKKQFGNNVEIVAKTLCDFGIKDAFAVMAILSNIAKECKFVPVREGMKYSSLDRLRAIFPSKFKSMSDSEGQQYVNNEEKLANFVYANSDGNGSVASGDGFNYRGGGYIQLTKKNNYKAVGDKLGIDLIASPGKVVDPTIAAKVAAQYFINRFGGANKLKFGSLDEALQTVTKKVNPGGFANDYPKVVTYSKLLSSSTTPELTQKDAAESVAAKPNAPENDLKKNATPAEIDAGIVGGVATSSRAVGSGFMDPNKKYPLNTFLKEPDTNRLSRRNTDLSSVRSRMKARRSGIRSIGSTFSEPAPAYNGQYPYNHVYASESGHIQEFDDTPGSERINTFHNSGSYVETDKFGNHTNKIVGDAFTIIERNGYIYIDGTARVTVGAGVKLVVHGDLDIEVDGNLNWDVGGAVTWKIGSDLKYGIGGRHSIQSSGDTAIDSSTINLNSGASESVAPSARSSSGEDYPAQTPDNFLDSETIKIDDADEDTVDATQKQQIKDGTVTQRELDAGKEAKPEVIDDKPPTKIEPLPASCEAFSGKTGIPDSTQLSKNFTLAMVSTKAKAGSHKCAPQHGLSESQIVCNLKQVAVNCLDKIKAQYPNMFVTSGFRVGGSKSQHERGEACDMQFAGVPNSGYFAIAQWIKDNVVFDQFLLEYKTIQSGNAWLHISYRENPRKQVLTLMNNKTAGQGLHKLQ